MTLETKSLLGLESIKNIKNAININITKKILMKPSEERSAAEHAILAPIIKNMSFLKTRIIDLK